VILGFGGRLRILAPEKGEPYAADLRVDNEQGESAQVWLTASECRHLASWFDTMAHCASIPVGARGES
jgi:hypothetical protein